MGLFNKLKNVLFEETEIEVPEKEEKNIVKKEVEVEHTPERKKNIYEEAETKENNLTDHELYTSEKTFNFPDFEEDEFENMKEKVEVKETPKKSMGINLFDYDSSTIKKEMASKSTSEIKGRAYETRKEIISGNKKFHPSPVISPVYGVLDKNYKKEDIIVAKEETKAINVDDVRKKAFGTLEDDIEKNLMEQPQEIEDKSIDELLKNTSFDTIEIPKVKEEPKETDKDNKELEVLDAKPIKDEKEAIKNDETLENDLFDLIDSMYENREDE